VAQVFVLLSLTVYHRFRSAGKWINNLVFPRISLTDATFAISSVYYSKPLQGHTPGSRGGKAKAASLFLALFGVKLHVLCHPLLLR